MAVVVAQLVERSLLIPEVRGSNPVIGKIYWIFVYCQLYWKDENKGKEAGNCPFFLKKTLSLLLLYFGSNVCHFYVGTYFSFRNYLSFVRCVGLRICITAAAAIAIACPHISSILAMTKLLLPIRNKFGAVVVVVIFSNEAIFCCFRPPEFVNLIGF